jgi:alpha-L-fucosidase
MNRRSFLSTGASAFAWAALAKPAHAQMFRGQVPDGPFQPDWESLESYQSPDWYRDAKLGIWAHWSPQCVPEDGDWYTRNMYIQGTPQYEFHVKTYGSRTAMK